MSKNIILSLHIYQAVENQIYLRFSRKLQQNETGILPRNSESFKLRFGRVREFEIKAQANKTSACRSTFTKMSKLMFLVIFLKL